MGERGGDLSCRGSDWPDVAHRLHTSNGAAPAADSAAELLELEVDHTAFATLEPVPTLTTTPAAGIHGHGRPPDAVPEELAVSEHLSSTYHRLSLRVFTVFQCL